MPRARRFARLLCGVRVILLGKERMHKIEKCFRKGNKGGDAGKAVRSAHGARLAPLLSPTDREGRGAGALDARRRHPRNAFKGRNERFYKAEPKRGMTRNRSGQACPLLFSASKDSPLPAFPEKSGAAPPVSEGSPSPAFPEKSGARRLQRRRAPSVLPGGPEPLSPRAARARGRPAFCAKSRRAGTRRG